MIAPPHPIPRVLGLALATVVVAAPGSASAVGARTATTATSTAALAAITREVPPTELVGRDLAVDHYDAHGYPESKSGLLVTAIDREAGPIVMMQGGHPNYLEAQVVNVQRDAVLLARTATRTDQRPDGTAFSIPHGFGALERSTSVITMVESQLVPHVSDNQKTYELFPLTDLYLGGALAVTGLLAEMRYVYTERWVAAAHAGLNILALAGARVTDTYGAISVPLGVSAGYRYPAVLGFLGTTWTTSAELTLGLGDADGRQETNRAILLPGVTHELEWTSTRTFVNEDPRTDPRPSDWGQQSFFARVGLYLDPFSGSGGSGGVLVDVAIGYRFNLFGPAIPPHTFKETQVTFASDRYVRRKLEEGERQRALEEGLKARQN